MQEKVAAEKLVLTINNIVTEAERRLTYTAFQKCGLGNMILRHIRLWLEEDPEIASLTIELQASDDSEVRSHYRKAVLRCLQALRFEGGTLLRTDNFTFRIEKTKIANN